MNTPGGSETRKPGYYHVVYDIERVAEWTGKYWRVTGMTYQYFDHDFSEIDERPIVRAAADENQEYLIDEIMYFVTMYEYPADYKKAMDDIKSRYTITRKP
jgi:hypothetical protein